MDLLKIHDDVLESSDFKHLEDIFCGGRSTFPWHYTQVVDPSDDGSCEEVYNFQLAHVFYMEERPYQWFDLVIPILKKLEVRSLIRIKANLLVRNSKIIQHGFHTDNTFNEATTAIYYVNSNNGYTEFEDGTKVESVANRLVTFPSSVKHSGTTCTNSPTRIVINFNYF